MPASLRSDYPINCPGSNGHFQSGTVAHFHRNMHIVIVCPVWIDPNHSNDVYLNIKGQRAPGLPIVWLEPAEGQ